MLFSPPSVCPQIPAMQLTEIFDGNWLKLTAISWPWLEIDRHSLTVHESPGESHQNCRNFASEALFKAQLGEPFLENWILSFSFNISSFSAKPALQWPKPAVERPNRHLKIIQKIKKIQSINTGITIGAENITYIKRIGRNLFDVTRCNTLHHLNCQEFIWCNVFWCCSFGVVMVPLGLTHIHDARIGDVFFKNVNYRGPNWCNPLHQ